MARARTGNSGALNLALQGGGVHGAFTWGVLDRLLEDELIEIEGISGTSAGAMNAAVLAQGFVRGGREGARKALDDFWRRIASYSTFGPIHRSAIDRMLSNWNLDHRLAMSGLIRSCGCYRPINSTYWTSIVFATYLRQRLTFLR